MNHLKYKRSEVLPPLGNSEQRHLKIERNMNNYISNCDKEFDKYEAKNRPQFSETHRIQRFKDEDVERVSNRNFNSRSSFKVKPKIKNRNLHLLLNDWPMSDTSEYVSRGRFEDEYPNPKPVFNRNRNANLRPLVSRKMNGSISDNDLRLPNSQTEEKKRSLKITYKSYDLIERKEGLMDVLKRKYFNTADRPVLAPIKPISFSKKDKDVKFYDDIKTQMSMLENTHATELKTEERNAFKTSTFLAFQKIIGEDEAGDRQDLDAVSDRSNAFSRHSEIPQETKRLQVAVDAWLKNRQTRSQAAKQKNLTSAPATTVKLPDSDVGDIETCKKDKYAYLTAPRTNNYGFEYMQWAAVENQKIQKIDEDETFEIEYAL